MIPRALRSKLRTHVLLTLKTGETFKGVLYEADRLILTIRNAEAVGAGEKSTDVPLDGELVVFIADVAYIQRP